MCVMAAQSVKEGGAHDCAEGLNVEEEVEGERTIDGGIAMIHASRAQLSSFTPFMTPTASVPVARAPV